LGYDVPFEKVRGQIGKGGDQLMPVFLPRDLIDREGETIERERLELFKRKYLPQVRAFPGTRELFLRLRAEGLKVVLASSAKQEELTTYEKIAGVADLIDAATS